MLNKLLLFVMLLAVGPSFGMEKECQQDIDEHELKSMTDVLPPELWCKIAEELDGENAFLNTCLARKIRLDKKIYDKIIASFLKRLGQVKNPIAAIENFGKTLHLGGNELCEHFNQMTNLAKAIIRSSSEYSTDTPEMSGAVKDAVKALIVVEQKKLSHFSAKEIVIMALCASALFCVFAPGGALFIEDVGAVLGALMIWFLGTAVAPFGAAVAAQGKSTEEVVEVAHKMADKLQKYVWSTLSNFEFNIESYKGISSICFCLAILGVVCYKQYGKRSESKLQNLQRIAEILE